jgi:hypothetical protein
VPWGRPSRRMTIAGALVAALAAGTVLLTPALSATAAATCTATLTFDTLDVITDTDENPPFAFSDHWSVHVYAYVNGVLGTANERKNGVLSGDTGAHVVVPNGTMLDHVSVGDPGSDVVLLIKQGHQASRVKESDPALGGHGVNPADQAPFSIRDTITGCATGSYTYPVDVPVPARPGGAAGEHDGLVRLTFTLDVS